MAAELPAALARGLGIGVPKKRPRESGYERRRRLNEFPQQFFAGALPKGREGAGGAGRGCEEAEREGQGRDEEGEQGGEKGEEGPGSGWGGRGRCAPEVYTYTPGRRVGPAGVAGQPGIAQVHGFVTLVERGV